MCRQCAQYPPLGAVPTDLVCSISPLRGHTHRPSVLNIPPLGAVPRDPVCSISPLRGYIHRPSVLNIPPLGSYPQTQCAQYPPLGVASRIYWGHIQRPQYILLANIPPSGYTPRILTEVSSCTQKRHPLHTWYFSASAIPSFSFPSRVLRSERAFPHASFRSDSLILPESRLSSSWQPSTSAVPCVLTDSREPSWFLKSRWRAWDGEDEQNYRRSGN